jgi:hypothetical protein
MSLEDDIKSIAKDGADLSGVLGQLEGLNPMNGLTKETAFDFIKSNQVLLSAFDSEVSKSVNSGVENFKSKGMQDILKEKEAAIRAEINPKETPTEKALREANERISAMENDKKLSILQDELSTKAKELDFDPIDARDFSIFGENAIPMLEKYAARETERVNERLDKEIKNKYKTGQPKGSSKPPADIDTRISEARAAGKTDLALKLQMMKNAQKSA